MGLGAGSYVRAQGRRLVVEVEGVRRGGRASLRGEESACKAGMLDWHGRLQLLLPLPVRHIEGRGGVAGCEGALERVQGERWHLSRLLRSALVRGSGRCRGLLRGERLRMACDAVACARQARRDASEVSHSLQALPTCTLVVPLVRQCASCSHILSLRWHLVGSHRVELVSAAHYEDSATLGNVEPCLLVLGELLLEQVEVEVHLIDLLLDLAAVCIGFND